MTVYCMMSSTYTLSFLLLALCHSHLGNTATVPLVTISNGGVQGSIKTSVNGRPFYAFQGIPFAQPPVADLRFQPPMPAKNWSGVLNATQDRNVCVQWTYYNVSGDEDCLFLYVYTPYLPPLDSLLPVLAYIPGGGFLGGGPNYEYYRPDRFMDHDVVFVTVGYRLGALGFLSTNDSASYGNYGMLDQVEALKWIQMNIGVFGGDKLKVTLFGESAGAASVSLHQVSNASAGLYRATISESGSAASRWALQLYPRKWADRLASALQCPTDNSSSLVSCLREKSAVDIITTTFNINGYSMSDVAFVPCLEDAVQGRFLTKTPDVTLAEGSFIKVPAIMGVNKNDGDVTYSHTQEYYTSIDDNFFNNILPQLIQNITKYDNNLVNVSYAVKAEYYDEIDVSNQTQVIQTSIDFNTDSDFRAPADYTVQMFAKYGLPVYMYSFEYLGSGSKTNFTGEGDVNHGDELFYLFVGRGNLTDDDQFISDIMVQFWVNFATELNPTINETYFWNPTPYQDDTLYLKFANRSITNEIGFFTSKMQFWHQQVPQIVYS